VQQYLPNIYRRYIGRCPNFHLRTPLCITIEDGWRHEVSIQMLKYYRNVLIDSILIQLINQVLFYCQPFHRPSSVESLGHNCNIENTNTNQGIICKCHNSWVQDTENEDDNIYNTGQGRVPSVPVLYLWCAPPYRMLQVQKYLPARMSILTFPMRYKKTPQWVLHSQAQEYVVVIQSQCEDPHGWANCENRLLPVVNQTNTMRIISIRAIYRLAHVVW